MRNLFIFLCAVMVWAAACPAQAESLTYDKAMAVKAKGDFVQAEKAFHSLLKREPSNAEFWFQLGLVQRFLEKREEAMQSQQKALALSPKNHDIRLELARLHYWKGEYDIATPMVQEVLAAHPDYTDAQDLAGYIERAKNAPPDTKSFLWQLDVGYENSSFSRRPQPDWHESFAQIGHWVQPDTLLHLRFEERERFKNHNQHYELGVAHIFNRIYNAQFSVGYTPDSIFVPQWRFKAGAEARLAFQHEDFGDSWLTLAAQHDRYKALDITIIKPGLRYTLFDDWQLHLQHINVLDEHDKHLSGWQARLDWQTPMPELRVFAGLADAPETENAIIVNTASRFGGFSYQLTPQVRWNASYAHEDRERSFIRDIVATSLSYKF